MLLQKTGQTGEAIRARTFSICTQRSRKREVFFLGRIPADRYQRLCEDSGRGNGLDRRIGHQ